MPTADERIERTFFDDLDDDLRVFLPSFPNYVCESWGKMAGSYLRGVLGSSSEKNRKCRSNDPESDLFNRRRGNRARILFTKL